MLTRLAELHRQRGAIFCFATNYYNKIDRAARGVGRFDEVVLFDRPDDAARRKYILKLWKEGTARASTYKNQVIPAPQPELLDELVKLTTGGAFLEIASVVKTLGSHYLEVISKASRHQELLRGHNHDDLQRLVQDCLPSRADYARWCLTDGLQDLKAVDGRSFDKETKRQIALRWNTVQPFCPDVLKKDQIRDAWAELNDEKKGMD